MASPKQRVRTRVRLSSAAVPRLSQETIELDDQPVFLRRAGEDAVPTLYLHGIPTSSFDWLAPLEQGMRSLGRPELATVVLAVIRGLLMDLDATGDAERTDHAFHAFLTTIENA